MARPHRKMLVPAIRCEKRWTFFRGSRLMPALAKRTAASIVEMVIAPKTPVTSNKPERLFSAAGYIRSGIKGSHGPKIKIANKTQGVMLMLPSSL